MYNYMYTIYIYLYIYPPALSPRTAASSRASADVKGFTDAVTSPNLPTVLRLSLLRFVDSKFMGNSLWT